MKRLIPFMHIADPFCLINADQSIIMKSVFPLTMLAIMAVMITSVTSRDMSSHRSYRGELLFCSIFKTVTLIVYWLHDLRLHQQKYPGSNRFTVHSL